MIIMSDKQAVTEIVGKTKAQMFTNLKVGDLVEFSVILKPVGSNRGRTHATYVTCKNLTNGESTQISFNQCYVLQNFRFEKNENT